MDIRLNIYDENNRWVGVDYLTEKGKWMHKWVNKGELERGSWRGRAVGDNDINWRYESVSQTNELLPHVNDSLPESEEEYEPYFGWCNVDGCENEGANGGCCWRETGYWIVCSKHSSEYRAGKPQPQMKKTAIDREKRRGADGMLVNEG